MNDITFYVKAFITLLVLINPLAGIPIFLSATQRAEPAVRAAITRHASIAVTITLLVALFLGNGLLRLFGISIGAFQIGGGVLLFLIAAQMISGSMGASMGNGSGGEIKEEFAFVPLAIPILAGPGAINGAVLYGTRTHSIPQMGILAGVIFLVGICTYASLRAAVPLEKYLKETGISIATRVMGLIVAAIAVEMIGHGIGGMFGLKVF